MVTLELDGRVTFTMTFPQAGGVEIVGAFSGWEERRYPMDRGEGDSWTATLDVAPGEHLYRYLVDGSVWALDLHAHGVCESVDGVQKSRLYRPPLSLSPDSIAA